MITDSVVVAVEAPELGDATARRAWVPTDPPGLGKRVPDEAYLAADRIFDEDHDGSGDELYFALCEASPYIRADEIERHLPTLREMASVTEVIRYLEGQRTLLSLFTT